MKKAYLLVFLITSLLSSVASFAQSTPDILTYTRTHKEWNVFLLEEFRVLMSNLSIKDVDPKNINLTDPLVYSQESLRKYVTTDLHNVLSNIGDFIGFKYMNVKPSLIVNEFGYSVKKIKPTISASEDRDGNVLLKSTVELSGLEASARNLSIELEVEGLTKKPRIRIHNPTIVLRRGAIIDFDLDVKFVEEGNNKMRLELSNGLFSRITDKLVEDPTLIDIIFDEEMIEFPEIKGSFAGRDLVLNHQKIIDLIVQNRSNLKVLLFDQLQKMLEKNIINELLEKYDRISFKTDRWIPASSESIFPVYLNLIDFSVPFDEIFMAEIAGDFCTTSNYVENGGGCIHSRVTEVPASRTTREDLSFSKERIRDNFRTRPDLKFLASVSEDYINKSIATTYDFGLWNPILKEVGIRLGDRNIEVRLDQTGTNATVLMDVVYDLTKMHRRFLREKFVRFPAILKATVRVEYGDYNGEKTAQVVFNIHDVVLDDDLLRYGHKEYGFPSNIEKMRRIFRRTVVKMIQKEMIGYDKETATDNVGQWSGIDLPAVPLPEINNMHLEKMKLEADGHGRLNIVLEGDTPVFRRRSRRTR